MNINKKVSIVIPVYNRSDLIIETLNSAINQTYKNIEIIVVDNKSTDSTFEVLATYVKSYNNIFLYQNEENIGIVRNWKKCIEYATGEYINLLWSDDLIAPTFIEKTISYLVNNDDIGFVFTHTEIFNSSGLKKSVYDLRRTGIYWVDEFINASLLNDPLSVPVSPANALFRKKDLEKNLLLDIPNKIGADFSKLGIGNDVLIYLLTCMIYPKFVYIGERLAFFRSHENSVTLSTNRLEVAIYYHIAKAYFVYKYNLNIKLGKKFNARLFCLFLLNKIINSKSNKLAINCIEDFYPDFEKQSINLLYMPKFILIMAWYFIKNKFRAHKILNIKSLH